MTRDEYPYPLPEAPTFRVGPCRVTTCSADPVGWVEVEGVGWPVCQAHAWVRGTRVGYGFVFSRGRQGEPPRPPGRWAGGDGVRRFLLRALGMAWLIVTPSAMSEAARHVAGLPPSRRQLASRRLLAMSDRLSGR